MPKFDFEIPVSADEKTAFEKIKKFLSGDNNFKKFDPDLTCTFDEPQRLCHVKGSQFKANMGVKASGAGKTKIHVEVDVPLALVLFKGKIKEEIEKNVKRVFG